jgi:hypothetical protein
MPPSREFTFKVNEVAKAELERHLRIPPVTIKTKATHEEGKRIHGSHSAGRITLFLNASLLSGSRLSFVNRQVIETLLHEFRHEYQVRHWDPAKLAADDELPYRERECEKDAEEWAQLNAARWLKLGRVVPKGTVSVFAAQDRRLAGRT